MKYTYVFCVWPSETWGFRRETYILFDMLKGPLQMDFTEREFELFCSALNHDGLTLREITRVPYHDAETIL